MRSFRIGSVFGIPIKLDLTFLLVLPLFAWLIGSQIGQTAQILNEVWIADIAADPLTRGSTPWVVGFVAAVGLFVGVVLHELGHSLVAMRFGFPIESITLWIFGGIASLTEMPEDWKQELAIAVAGPIVSVAVGVVCFLGFGLVPTSFPAGRFVLAYLALLNLTLAAFNMLPGFPMDGGRVLRALLARTRPYAQATQIAAEVGKAFALLLGLAGLLLFGNIIMIGLAFFIYIGASSEAQQTLMKAAFEGVTVGDVMTPLDELETVEPDISVAELIGRMVRQRHTGYPVMDGEELVGLVTLDDAREVREVERDAYTVEEVMSRELTTVSPETDAMTAITTLQSEDVGRLPVTEDGRLVGLISRSDLMTAFEIIRSSQRLKPRESLDESDPHLGRPPEEQSERKFGR